MFTPEEIRSLADATACDQAGRRSRR